MGQYFKGVILPMDYKENLTETAEVAETAWHWDNGSKLMEHSYLDNNYVNLYVYLLSGKYKGYPFVWCGDYADDIRCHICNKPMDEYNDKTIIPYNFIPLNRYQKKDVPSVRMRYIFNYDTKQYVDLEKVEGDIHPLPILTCSGNGRGSGDYHGTDMDKVGIWAYGHIGVGDELPDNKYNELIVNFVEKY